MTDKVTIHYQGLGPGVSKQIDVDELEEYGDDWKVQGEIGGTDCSGYTAEELSGQVDELVPEEKSGDTVLDLSEPGEETRTMQINPLVTPDRKLKKFGFSEGEIEEMKEAQIAENKKKKEQGLASGSEEPSEKSWNEIKDEARDEWRAMQEQNTESREALAAKLRMASRNQSSSTVLYQDLADDVLNGEFGGNDSAPLPGEELSEEEREAAISAFEDYASEEEGTEVWSEFAEELREVETDETPGFDSGDTVVTHNHEGENHTAKIETSHEDLMEDLRDVSDGDSFEILSDSGDELTARITDYEAAKRKLAEEKE